MATESDPTRRTTFGDLQVGDKFIMFFIDPEAPHTEGKDVNRYASMEFGLIMKVKEVKPLEYPATTTFNAVNIKTGHMTRVSDNNLVIRVLV